MISDELWQKRIDDEDERFFISLNKALKGKKIKFEDQLKEGNLYAYDPASNSFLEIARETL